MKKTILLLTLSTNILSASKLNLITIELHKAAYMGRHILVNAFLKSGTPVNMHDEHNKTALHYAAEQGRIDVTKALLGAGADPEATDSYGYTPLYYALRNKYPSQTHADRVVELLLSACRSK